jgi:trehalose 6-phosphate synthase
MTQMEPIVVASNRGPIAFVRTEDGNLVQRRGVGGLVTAVGGALRGRDASWVAAAITPEDRARAADEPILLDMGGGRVRLRLVAVEQDRYDAYYNELSNRVLWFVHHYLWETPRAPAFGADEQNAWLAYKDVNQRFAQLIAEEASGDTVALPQDYHLSLVPALLRKERPDMPIASFWHIPFCQPDQFRVLPDAWATELLEGMLGADVIGFQTERWAGNFLACCRESLGARVRGRNVTHGGRSARVGAFPIGVNAKELEEEAAKEEVARAGQEIDRSVSDRLLILRVDRTELSKNILRGFLAYEQLLERRPDLHRRVVHLALLTPSRRNVIEYQEYMRACTARADRINERFSTPDWIPLILEIADDYPKTLAAYRRYDVLIVNPVYDGMNLVAREGPLLNERDGVLVLSRNAGAAVELAPAALLVNPFDPQGTSAALETAVDMPPAERKQRAARLRPLASGTSPERWLGAQIKEVARRSSS